MFLYSFWNSCSFLHDLYRTLFIEQRSLLNLIPVTKQVKVTSSYWPATLTVGYYATFFLHLTNISSCIFYVHFLRHLKVQSISLVGRADWMHSVSSIGTECRVFGFFFLQLWKPVFASKLCRKLSLSMAGELELDNLGFIPTQTLLRFY